MSKKLTPQLTSMSQGIEKISCTRYRVHMARPQQRYQQSALKYKIQVKFCNAKQSHYFNLLHLQSCNANKVQNYFEHSPKQLFTPQQTPSK